MKKFAKSVISHGVVFLYDSNSIIITPPDTSAGPILSTSTCISIWTIDEECGEVDLIISSDELSVKDELRFLGIITTKSGNVSLNDSSTNPIAGITVPPGEVKVSIFSNDALYPSKLTCLISPII